MIRTAHSFVSEVDCSFGIIIIMGGVCTVEREFFFALGGLLSPPTARPGIFETLLFTESKTKYRIVLAG